VHDVDAIVNVPGRSSARTKENLGDELMGMEEVKKEEREAEKERVAVDEACWIYEQLR
jgi:hypothetical protein